MKTRLYYVFAPLVLALIFSSCRNDTAGGGRVTGQGDELTLSAQVTEMTRLVGDKFFSEGGVIDVTLTTNKAPGTELKYKYTYGADNIFRGDPGYHFPTDDTYIASLTAIWPSAEIRANEIVTDQRELENFKLADWMEAITSASGIVATDAAVPLTFVRQNALLDFELVGQNTEGLDIEELLIELHDKNTGDPVAYWAYCGNDNGHAEIIIDGGTSINSTDSYLIGTVRVTNEYTYYIVFHAMDITFQPGSRYLITLTPQGFDMVMYAEIKGWSDVEHGIGIPFQQPTPGTNGEEFIIETPQQLVAMSYLIRHYTDGRTFNWPTYTYVIADNFTMTEEEASLYIPMPESLFEGTVLWKGGEITQLPYGNGQILELFTTD